MRATREKETQSLWEWFVIIEPLPSEQHNPKAKRKKSSQDTERKLFRLFFFLFFFFLDRGLFVRILFFVFFLIFVISNRDQMNGMSLRHFKLRIALMAAQNFAFFHFVFVQIDFGVAFGTSGH